MLETLRSLFENYRKTCSITNIQDGCVTFARTERHLELINGIDKDAWIIVPIDVDMPCNPNDTRLKYYRTIYPEYEFTLFHNEVYKDFRPLPALVGMNCNIHPTVIADVEGLKVVNDPGGKKVSFKHMGRVLIADNVDIGPYTVIHRGTLESTKILSGCKIGAQNNIGHNCLIEQDTVFAVGVILNGGVKVGRNCWFGSGAVVKHYTSICDNVVIGMGAVVTKDITEPGIYVGNPARYLKPVEEGWNF